MTTHGLGVLLDRDGTIIDDVGYLDDPSAVRLVDGAGPALGALAAAGAQLIIVSNQSGVGRGYFDTDAMWAVDAEVRRQLAAHGAHVAGSYYCVHGPDEGCACRKPAPGLLGQALAEHHISPGRAVMVGDKPSDLEAAAALDIAAYSIVETPWVDLETVIVDRLAGLHAR